jgi:hypothetical protein
MDFTVEIEACERSILGESTCVYDKLMIEMVRLLENELVISTESAQRSRPLMISRLARGGKTTLLSLLFDELKRQHRNVRVIFITFNGSSNFETRQGESQRNAILRVIATQLVSVGGGDSLNLSAMRVSWINT